MNVKVTPGMFSSRKPKKSSGYKSPIVMAATSAIMFVFFGLLGVQELVVYRITPADAAFSIPDIVVGSHILGLACGVVGFAMAAFGWFTISRGKTVSRWFNVAFGAVFVVALLGWVGAGDTVPITFLLSSTIALSVPIILGGMSGIMSERVGVVNIAIEGQLLTGAFVAAVVGTMTGSFTVAILAAMVAAALLSMILASFSIWFLVDQIIVGVVLNVLVIGITNFLYSQWLTGNEQEANFPGTLPSVPLPFLSDIPLLGPIFFDQRVTVYLVFILVPLLWWMLFKTRAGLRLRAVGEYPMAADTMGISVTANRFWWVTVGGMLAGLGGAALTVGNVGSFVREMSAGQGFIALATVILGRWHPFSVAAAALLFGFASTFRIWASQISSGIPSDFIAMIPYLVTLIAVAGFVGAVRAPASAGKAYRKE